MEPANNTARIENWGNVRELVLMSVGTDKGSWWADPAFGSELYLLKQAGKVDWQTAGALRRMILECTEWLVIGGLAKRIECDAERAGKNEIVYRITAFRPDGGSDEIRGAWDAA